MAKIQPRKLKEEHHQPHQPDLDARAQEETLRALQAQDKKKNVQRVTIDFPQYIYDQIKEETEYSGQTIKGFLVGLVREHFVRKSYEKNQGRQ